MRNAHAIAVFLPPPLFVEQKKAKNFDVLKLR